MRHTPILERQVRDMLQFSLFWSYYKTRLQHKEGTLPEFKVDFSTIGPEKPSTDDKDFYQCFIHLSTLKSRGSTKQRLFFKNGIGKPADGQVIIMESYAHKQAIDGCDYNQSNGEIHLRDRKH